MRRADRLFQIIQYLRSRRVTTALWLAETLEVSERTIYRDISDLMVSGVPVEGEAGIGYVLKKGFDLPPLMFTSEEIAALTLGARIVQSWADPKLANAASLVLQKVENVLPDKLKEEIEQTPLFSPMTRLAPDVANILSNLRTAINQRDKISVEYARGDGEMSQRIIWPLGLFFWGQVWTLGAWCELRNSLRSFRVDRIQSITIEGSRYPISKGCTLEDFIACYRFDDNDSKR